MALGILVGSHYFDITPKDYEKLPNKWYIVNSPIVNKLSIIRERALSNYKSHLSPQTYTIVAAMTLGEKPSVIVVASPRIVGSQSRIVAQRIVRSPNGVSPLHPYRVTGVSHIFALSGLHLAILFGLVGLLLPLRAFPRFSETLRLLLLWLYVLIVGIHPSLLRASVMLTIYTLCRMTARRTKSIDVLLLTIFLLLLLFPHWLYDPGFQMSCAALAGILLLAPRLKRDSPPAPLCLERGEGGARLKGLRILRALGEGLITTLIISFSATLAVAPLVVLYFGRLSCYSLLINLLISPFVPLILCLALAFQLVLALAPAFQLASGVLCFPALATLLAHLLEWAVGGMQWIVEWGASLPGASIEGIPLSAPQTILVYVVIIAVLAIARICMRTRHQR